MSTVTKQDPAKAIFVCNNKLFNGTISEMKKHRDLIWSDINKIALMAKDLFNITKNCTLVWVEEEPCNWKEKTGTPCLQIILKKARSEPEGVKYLSNDTNVCPCIIRRCSLIERFDFSNKNPREQFYVHFREVDVADWFKKLPCLLEQKEQFAMMYLKGAFEKEFLVTIHEYEITKTRMEEMEYNEKHNGKPRDVDPNNRYKSEVTSEIKTGYVPNNQVVPKNQVGLHINVTVSHFYPASSIESGPSKIAVNLADNVNDSGIPSSIPCNTPVLGKDNQKEIKLSENERLYLNLGHLAIWRQLIFACDFEINEILITLDKELIKNQINPQHFQDLTFTLAYINQVIEKHFPAWISRFQGQFSDGQLSPYFKLLAEFANISRTYGVFSCHVAMVGYREHVSQC